MAICSLLCDRQQGSVKPTAGRRVTVSREGVGVNTFGEIENTLGLFKISFGVSEFSAGVKGKSAVQTGRKCLGKRERMPR